MALLSPEARRFYRLRFKSHEELMPWLLREKRSKNLHTDSEMRRQLAYFISKTRYELEKAGYSLTSRQDGSSGDSPTKTLFPKIKSLWHSLTTTRPNDEDFDDIFTSVAQIENSLENRQEANEEFDKWLEERRIQNEEWLKERRRRYEETEKLLEEHRQFMEEIKQREEQRKREEEEWQREWEERKRRHKEEEERRQKEREDWEKELEEIRQRQKEREEKWREREEEEKERRRIQGRQKFLEDLEKWKENKRLQAGNGLKVEQEPVEQTYLSYTWPRWTWNSEFEEHLRRQYHNLICLFPRPVRETLISIIPTLDDLREKTSVATTFSGALRDKDQLDLFIEIFGFINKEYPYQITEIEYLYEQMTGGRPHHDLTLDESVTLRLLENTAKSKERERLLRNHHPSHPSPSGYSHNSCSNLYLIDPNNAVFCEQTEGPPPLRLDELFCPTTAYPDFIILAVTAVQAAKKVSNKLYALKNRYGYYDKFSVASLSKTRIHMYASYEDSSFTDELFLVREGENLFISYDKEDTEKSRLQIKTGYFDELCTLEREFQLWLDRLRTVLLRLSDDRLVIYGDFYKIKVFDKSNQQSCSIYTLNSWIESHDIREVAKFHVKENPSDYHPWNFPGKYHY